MAALNEAYEVLSNPELRQRFDNGEDPMDPQAQQGGHPFQGNPFGGFGGGFPGGGFPGGGFPGGGFPGGGGFGGDPFGQFFQQRGGPKQGGFHFQYGQ